MSGTNRRFGEMFRHFPHAQAQAREFRLTIPSSRLYCAPHIACESYAHLAMPLETIMRSHTFLARTLWMHLKREPIMRSRSIVLAAAIGLALSFPAFAAGGVGGRGGAVGGGSGLGGAGGFSTGNGMGGAGSNRNGIGAGAKGNVGGSGAGANTGATMPPAGGTSGGGGSANAPAGGGR
jgi:hypothetical protein